MKALIALALLASTLTGCAVYTPAGSVVIDPAGRHDSGGGGQGRFCPPGQAKKYRVGYPLPDDVVYVPVPRDLLVHLSPVPAGYQYVKVDKDVLLIAEASKKVIDAVTLLSAVGN